MLTNKTFTKRLNSELAIATTQRDSFQALILSGLAQYNEQGNTYQLSLLISASVSIKSIPTVTMKDYIKSLTDLVYKKNKAGEYQFIRADKDADKVCDTKPIETWYDWKKAKHNNVKETDYGKRLVTDAKKLLEGGKRDSILPSLIAAGLTTKDIMNMINSMDSLQLAA